MLTGIPFVDAHGALRPGQLLEVCGVGGSGKTEILMQAAVHAVMPRKRGGVAFGGCEASVLLIDLDGKFDTLRLIKILTAKIRDTVDDASARAHCAASPSSAARTARRRKTIRAIATPPARVGIRSLGFTLRRRNVNGAPATRLDDGIIRTATTRARPRSPTPTDPP